MKGMLQIPTKQTSIPKQYNNHNFERLYNAARCSHCGECLRRIGVLSCTNELTDYRICQNHLLELIEKPVDYYDLKNNKQTSIVKMYVPVSYDNIIVGNGNINEYNNDQEA
jgi:hypothetical protein